MKALLIGGTGTISSACSKLAVEKGWELYLLNRGNHPESLPEGCHILKGDGNDEKAMEELMQGMSFDAVANFIVFTPEQLERDIRLFSGKTDQYMFISSATVYKKPPTDVLIQESCTLNNPYWIYAQQKIACEEALTRACREKGFHYTIIRPSHTYSAQKLPLAVHGKNGSWQVVDRIRKGKPVIVQGDGTTLWTLTHSTDFAKAFVGLMGNRLAVDECFHITSDEAITWNALYEMIGKKLGVKPEIVHIPTDFLVACDELGRDFYGSLLGDKANVAVFDNSKVKKAVPEFVCTTSIEKGIGMSLDFLLSHPEYQIADPDFDVWCDRVIASYRKGLAAFHGEG